MVRTLPFLLLAALISLAASPMPGRGRLLYQVETLDGRVLAGQGSDTPFNPASVVKVATSLWALDRLGPDHRYTTLVGYRGVWNRETGVVDGQLVVDGGGDPDFQAENGFLVARELNRLGIRRVTDGLVVTGEFTLGWEHGAEGRLADPSQRAMQMAQRVRQALDHGRWSKTLRAAWYTMSVRRGWDPGAPPGVRIQGPLVTATQVEHTPLVRHVSNPLEFVLKRFNAFSNNDIIRVADGLGGPEALERFLQERLKATPAQLELATASGEGSNRFTPRLVVRLLREMYRETGDLALAPRDLLPVPGCDSAPVARMFPALTLPPYARSLAVKTGTLRFTDGGVAALAGYFQSPEQGMVLFCVAAPGAGRRILQWRRVEQEWLLDLITAAHGVEPGDCGPELSAPDALAAVESLVVVEERVAAETSLATRRKES